MAVGWKPRSVALSLWSIAALLVLAGCTRQEIEAPHRFFGSSVPITASARALAPGDPCGDAFVRHSLDHTTVAGDQVVALYESNGSGTALNDLDEDGDLDIVLANLHGPNSILWNEGDLRFRTEHLAHGDSRGVAIVDVDGDGRQDIVFTRRLAKPSFWRNTGAAGDARFVEGELPNVHNPFYSMNWGDLDGDGDLDLVAGSYDTELRKSAGAIFDYHGGGVGVFVYTN
ncbi:MAG TPA: VCBS repeat-containing protein, partial [Herpetosiphonaceae bacterium]|nr:VCBS repeat-containing protein [Herpetosiphonaceae bacterium]